MKLLKNIYFAMVVLLCLGLSCLNAGGIFGKSSKEESEEVVLGADGGGSLEKTFSRGDLYGVTEALRSGADVGDLLRKAVSRGDLYGVTEALGNGANPNPDLVWPLMLRAVQICKKERRELIVRFLVDAGTDIDAQEPSGWTALAYAVWKNDEDLVKLLLELGADVLVCGRDGWGPLRWAVNFGYLELVELLVQVLNQQNQDKCWRHIFGQNWNKSPVHFARTRPRIFRELYRKEANSSKKAKLKEKVGCSEKIHKLLESQDVHVSSCTECHS